MRQQEVRVALGNRRIQKVAGYNEIARDDAGTARVVGWRRRLLYYNGLVAEMVKTGRLLKDGKVADND